MELNERRVSVLTVILTQIRLDKECERGELFKFESLLSDGATPEEMDCRLNLGRDDDGDVGKLLDNIQRLDQMSMFACTGCGCIVEADL